MLYKYSVAVYSFEFFTISLNINPEIFVTQVNVELIFMVHVDVIQELINSSVETSLLAKFCILDEISSSIGAALRVDIVRLLFINSIGLIVYSIAFSFHNQALIAAKKSNHTSEACLVV